MIIQYPHTVSTTTITASTLDANGNYSTAGVQNLTLMGRAEPASANGLIAGPDGTLIKFAWIVYFPLPMNLIPVGTELQMMNGSEFVGKGKVIRFSKGQINARAWL